MSKGTEAKTLFPVCQLWSVVSQRTPQAFLHITISCSGQKHNMFEWLHHHHKSTLDLSAYEGGPVTLLMLIKTISV